jgi:histidine ammonia-lyase
MMAHVTAAALTAEMKILAHPASVDTIPTSAGREDHVSMSMGATLKVAQIIDLVTGVLAIELLAARADVPTLDQDRPPSPDIETLAALIASGELEQAIGQPLR